MEGIWSTLRERLDYASFVPRLVPDIERAELRRRDGSTYYVLKNPRGGRGAGLYARLEPEWEELAGWQTDTTACRSWHDLPAAARAYVERLEALAGVPISHVSVGPEREQMIVR